MSLGRSSRLGKERGTVGVDGPSERRLGNAVYAMTERRTNVTAVASKIRHSHRNIESLSRSSFAATRSRAMVAASHKISSSLIHKMQTKRGKAHRSMLGGSR